MTDLPLTTLLFDSAKASVRFAIACLEPFQGHLRARSSFVNPQGEVMSWHDFGDLEGPGWAANALGGAGLLYRWGSFTHDQALMAQSLALVDHVLDDGFIESDGFIWPYFDLAKGTFCLNYTHFGEWLCPGSLAKIGTHLLEMAEMMPGTPRAARLEKCALNLAAWLDGHTPRLPNGWIPRRITRDGQAYTQSATGGPDAIYDHSADGLFTLELFSRLTGLGLADYAEKAIRLGSAFIQSGGMWGSLNHDTYDDHESVAYAVAFRILRQAALVLGQPAWTTFCYQTALPSLARFRMGEDRNGVATRGLLWMEESWDTAYLWENAEAAHAYLESWVENESSDDRETGLGILRAIANHHHGTLGFLTEGVDWNNHVSQQHHVDQALYGDINYTEPLLNNLHHLGPTLFYFQRIGFQPPAE